MTVDILHISDTHIGPHYNEDFRRKDFTRAYMEAIEIAIEEDVDVVTHGGDLFDKPNPDIRSMSDCVKGIRRLEDEGIPFLAIVGNHERKLDQQWVDFLGEFASSERLSREPRYVENENTKVAIYGIDAVRQPEWKSTDFTLEGPDDDTTYKILLMHELFKPPLNEDEADYELTDVIDRVGIDIDFFALGDYHQKSLVSRGGKHVLYPGSTEKTSTREDNDKSVYKITVDGSSVDVQSIKLESTREFKEIEVELDEDDDLSKVQEEVSKIDFSDYERKPIAIVKLKGENREIEEERIRSLFNDSVKMVKVKDKRESGNYMSDLDSVDSGVTNVEEKLDEKVSELDLSEDTNNIEQFLREGEVPVHKVRNEVQERLEGDKE